ncbi:hypothetical protein, partial [Dyella acidiphila]|uniref:hypothetical protein n=1 Tax=Dyella acidiphila TaxID=2775866 RepID=UPI001CE3D31E
CEESTSASRSLWMISSELKRFLGIVQSPRHKSMNFGSGPEISGQLSAPAACVLLSWLPTGKIGPPDEALIISPYVVGALLYGALTW